MSIKYRSHTNNDPKHLSYVNTILIITPTKAFVSEFAASLAVEVRNQGTCDV